MTLASDCRRVVVPEEGDLAALPGWQVVESVVVSEYPLEGIGASDASHREHPANLLLAVHRETDRSDA